MGVHRDVTKPRPSAREIRAAQEATGYRYADPVEDPAHPHITAFDPEDPPDVFPEGWSSQPTERDQAAIDAGNA